MPNLDIVVPAYNAAPFIVPLIRRLTALTVPPGWRAQVYLVDDASSDGTAALVESLALDAVQLIRLPNNVGRAAARNTGANSGSGLYILFLDADCLPQDNDYLVQLTQCLLEGAEVVHGPAVEEGTDFWASFSQRVYRRRMAQAAAGHHWQAFTSANFLIRRDVFERVGGFCEQYRAYGFEDRDFAASLNHRSAMMAVCPQAMVTHIANNDVRTYSLKMYQAGRYSAPLFRARHGALYQQLPLSRFDWSGSWPPIRAAMRVFFRVASALAMRLAERAVAWRRAPFIVQLSTVRLAAILCFALGSVEPPPEPGEQQAG